MKPSGGYRRDMRGPAPGDKSTPVERTSANKKGTRRDRRKLKELSGKFGGRS